jgi:hypothetical protein
MKPRLMAIAGTLRGTVHPLVDGQTSIGREDSNSLCLIDPAVSRKHCTIQQVDDHYELADLASHNGTFVNGIPVNQIALDHADTIRVGTTEFVFLVRESEEANGFIPNLSDEPSIFELKTIRLDEPALLAPFEADGGRMARDLAALFKVSNIINSIRDPGLLQKELLKLILEVIPAENGAIALLTNLDEEPESICNWSRNATAGQPIKVQRDLVHRAIWERSAIFANAPSDSSDIQHVVCLPLVTVDKTIGVIYLTSSEPASPFREDQIHCLSAISRIAAVTIEKILSMDAVSSENQRLKEQLHSSKMVSESYQIGQLEKFIAQVAQRDSTVLIRGESGTGKELVARAIHSSSPRAERPFVAINCAAIPEALLESELFGHEKGAFTGAIATKRGKLEVVEDGTAFFDEIGELAPILQAKLLRVLQQKEFERLGGHRSLTFKARVLAATNKNLEQAIESGEFRQGFVLSTQRGRGHCASLTRASRRHSAARSTLCCEVCRKDQPTI